MLFDGMSSSSIYRSEQTIPFEQNVRVIIKILHMRACEQKYDP